MALTKIIATIGPATEKEKDLIELINSGADVFRLNLKHNLLSWHNSQVKKIRKVSAKLKKPIGLIVDLPTKKENFEKNFRQYLEGLSQISQVDFLAISFVEKKKEIEALKKYLAKRNLKIKVIAKIESAKALKNFKEILESADGILIARGDLALQIPYTKVPFYQKQIIKKCLEKGKPVIVATQMLASMVENPFPTRAEISDVANAILDNADAVMLSEETAIGKYPKKAVEIMEKICRFWEKKREFPLNFNFEIKNQPTALCYSAFHLYKSDFCQKQRVKAFLILSKTGFTPRMLSRLRPKIPIFVFTNYPSVLNQLTLSFGVFPCLIDFKNIYQKKRPEDIKEILNESKKAFGLKPGDLVIFLAAEDWGKFGRAHILRIQNIP